MDPSAQLRQTLRTRMAALSAAAIPAFGGAGCTGGPLDPHGPIGEAQKTILLNALGIMLVIVVPTIVATLVMAWWFRAANRHATYRPLWEFSGKIEIVVWSIPAMVVLLLGGVAWVGSHDLDPARPIASTAPTVEVEVVALDWKWLFVYPGQGVATVNRLVVPAGSPIALKLTSATVMNSFFVPQLGSQIYAMPGMATRLHLLASRPGRYAGLSAQFSGDGFSGMRFGVESVTQEEFRAWAETAKSSGAALDAQRYAELALPSRNVAPTTYGSVLPGLFKSIVDLRPSALAVCRPGRDGQAQAAGPQAKDL